MGKKHILIIDDEETTCRAVGRVLQIENYKVTIVNDGEKALSVIMSCKKGEEIDALITDIQMPNMNGLELINYLENNGVDIPTIVISAHCEKKVLDKIKHKGKINFLEKPFGSLEILKSLKEILT